jgi:hypothetical protein
LPQIIKGWLHKANNVKEGKMNKTIIATLSMSTTLLIGCNNSSEGDITPSSVSGRVADGYLSGATICLDENTNMVCDDNEPTTTSNSEGQYSLNITEDEASQYPIIAIVTPDVTDQDTNDYVPNAYTLVSPPGKQAFISPITTLLALSAKDYSDDSLATSASVLRMQLGVSDDVDLYSDFIAAQTGNDSSSYKKVHNTAQLVARKLGQHLTTFNSGDSSGVIDRTKLVVAVDSVHSVVADLAELADSNDFDADAVAISKSQEWNNEVKDIIPSEKVEQIEAEQGLPAALSGGVYQYIDIEGNKTDYLTVKLNTTTASYSENISIVVTNDSGDSYSFEAVDSHPDDLDFPQQVAFVKRLPGDSLVSGTYTYTLSDGEGNSVMLFKDNYIQPVLTNYSSALLASGMSWVETPFDNAFLSFPVTDDELYYQAILLGTEDNIVYTGRNEQGRNIILYDDLDDMRAATSLLVKASDGSNHRDSNFTRELFKTGVTESTDASYIGFVRTYFRNSYNVPSDSAKQRYIYQFNAEPAAEEEGTQLTKKVSSFKIEHFDSNSSTYVETISANISDTVFEELGTSEEDAEQNGYNLWHQLDKDESVIFLDAFFQGDTSSAVLAKGTYRYSITDVNGNTFHSYDYYGGESKGFPELSADSFTAKELNADWYQLSIDTADGDNSSLIYEFQFNVDYAKDGEEQSNYLLSLGKQREATALIRKQRLTEAVSKFEADRGVEVTGYSVDVSIFDSAKTYKTDNRFEITNIDFDKAIEANTN